MISQFHKENEFLKSKGVALTGSIATGKTFVGKILTKKGLKVIDADDLARSAVAKGSIGLSKIIEKFGANFLTPKGELDRQKMRQLVFSSPDEREALEQIIHPIINQLLLEKISNFNANENQLFFYEASLIFEKQNQKNFLTTVTCHCARDIQKLRLMTRDSITADRAELLMQSQMSSSEKARLARFVIRTDGDFLSIERDVERVLVEINRLL